MKLNTNTVDNFDIMKYLGLWHQIATIPSWFQRNLINVTAEYSLISAGKIKVINRGVHKSSKRNSMIEGTATIAQPFRPSWLKVKFFFFSADYFVLELDPNYGWAMVGADANSLWILCRQKQFSIEFFEQLKEKAKNRGYNVDKLEITR